MKRKQKFGYKFHPIEDENKAKVATEEIFKKIPFSRLIYLEKCIFNGSALELRKDSLKNTFISFFKHCGDNFNWKITRNIYSIFKVNVRNHIDSSNVNVKYEPYYRSFTKEEALVQDVRVYTGIETKFIFKDYEC